MKSTRKRNLLLKLYFINIKSAFFFIVKSKPADRLINFRKSKNEISFSDQVIIKYRRVNVKENLNISGSNIQVTLEMCLLLIYLKTKKSWSFD